LSHECFDVARLKPQGLLEVLQGSVTPSSKSQGAAQAAVQLWRGWPQSQCLAVGLDSLLDLAKALVTGGEQVPGLGMVALGGDDLTVQFAGLPQVAAAVAW
jgi:hypothetical protein